jgi:peptidoglycan/xylan/chitin deacetylase (PgdA/CDA1 family)
MKLMHDLFDYSDYTAEIVRGALLDAHDALCELIGGATKAEIGGVAAWLRKLATEQPAWTPNGPYKEPPER